MKLRTRLFSILLTTSLIPILIFSVISMSLSISISKNDIYQSSQDKLEVVKAEINGMLEKNFNTLHMVANQPAVGDFDLNSAKNILVGAANVNSDLVIALDNAQGEQVAKSNDDAFTNVLEREFFQQAMNGNEKYVSDILISKVTGKSNVVISTPVRDRNNKIVGALQASTELSKISDFVARLSQDGTKVYVLSRQGIVIAHPNIEYVENQEDFSALEFVQAGLSGNNTTLRTKNIQGEDVIVSHALNELSGWLIVVETPFSVAMSSAFNLLNVAVILFVAVAVIVGLLGLYFSKRFTAPLVELSSIIQTIADGDLKDFEVKFNSKDEIGQVFNSLKSMITNLRRLVGSIQTVASTVASHSLQLSLTSEEATQSLTQVVTTINEMAQGNSEQASMIQETTDATIKVTEIISESTKKTKVAADQAKTSLELAKKGQEALMHQGQKIEENNQFTYAVGQSIHQLATMADEIRNIIGEINNIAGQTNLLALNASIEAARAGEAGRGFAVVAEEIRKLAEQSGNATKRIENIVNDINDRVNEAVQNMNQVKESVLAMEYSAEDTKESFDKIFDSIAGLAQISHDISIALEQIYNQIEAVTSNAENISSVAEQTSAGMQEISATSEEQLASMETIAQSSGQLKDVANELLDQVTKFRIK